MITTVSSSTASASTTTSATSNALGQEDFLEILIAQLQNQDPTDPVESFHRVHVPTHPVLQPRAAHEHEHPARHPGSQEASESMTGAELAGLSALK